VFFLNGDLIARPLSTLADPRAQVEVAAAEQVVTPRATPVSRSGPSPRPPVKTPVLALSRPPRTLPPPRTQPSLASRPRQPAEPERDAALGNASFNCRLARPGVETAICQSDKLSSLDRFVVSFYGQSMRFGDSKKRAALVESRSGFLARRGQCGSDRCLQEAYLGHMREISRIVETGQAR
jgi:hypothetical protein